MSVEAMIDAGIRAFKGKATAILEQVVESELTQTMAQEVTQGLQQVIAASGGAAFQGPWAGGDRIPRRGG